MGVGLISWACAATPALKQSGSSERNDVAQLPPVTGLPCSAQSRLVVVPLNGRDLELRDYLDTPTVTRREAPLSLCCVHRAGT